MYISDKQVSADLPAPVAVELAPETGAGATDQISVPSAPTTDPIYFLLALMAFVVISKR